MDLDVINGSDSGAPVGQPLDNAALQVTQLHRDQRY